MSLRVRRPGFELDDLERAARQELLRLGERREGTDQGQGTRLCLLLNAEDLAGIGLPRSLVEKDLVLSLDRWAGREVPSRRPINLELAGDPSLKPGGTRVWLMPGRAEPVGTEAEAETEAETETETGTGEAEAAEPVEAKSDRIARAGRSRRPKRGYSAMSTLLTRRASTSRGRTLIAVLVCATLVAAILFLAGPALADVQAQPGPAPDVVAAGEVATEEADAGEGSGLWLPIVLIGALAVGGLAILAGVFALMKRSSSRPAEDFPNTLGHQVVDEGIEARQESQADTAVMLENVRTVRDVAREANSQPAVDASVKLEQSLQRIRQALETMPAGRLAASTGREGRLAAAVDNDIDAAKALQQLADDLVALRHKAVEGGGGDLTERLTELLNRADDVRDLLTRRPQLIQD